MIRSPLCILVLLAGTIAAAHTPPGSTPAGQGTGPAMPPAPPPPLSEPASSAPTPTPNPAAIAQAKSVFAQLQGGTIDRSLLEPTMSSALTDDKLSTLKGSIGSLGAPISFDQQRAGLQGDLTYALYLLTFKDGTKLQLLDVMDKQGKIAGLKLTPP
ncbi:MAG TPA: hypothetical protein VHS56_03985 [Candidatus Cybelea sp.]|jgi:hypothetical protein|nr:hypothetical protein [Candidatus Cybelea sp.]